jgi:hypothetical protein
MEALAEELEELDKSLADAENRRVTPVTTLLHLLFRLDKRFS